MLARMNDLTPAQRKVRELVHKWIEGDPGWFALEDDSGIAVILGTERALPRLLETAFPCLAASDDERAVTAAIRELCEAQGPCGCLALNEYVNIYFGAKDALSQKWRSPL
jgi:hypothetical protein